MWSCKLVAFVIVFVSLGSSHFEEGNEQEQRDLKTSMNVSELELIANMCRNVVRTDVWAADYSPKKSVKRSQDVCIRSNCGIWTRCINDTCMCKRSSFFHSMIKCEKHTNALSVIDCHCMTYDPETGKIETGSCTENCMNVAKQSLRDEIYHLNLLPENVTSLNELMCGQLFNRGGRLCGKCLHGFSPQAYSFNITCVKCPEGNLNLWKYFLIALTPLTCFYFVVLFFKINTTSSHLHGYVLFAQAISMPQLGRLTTITMRLESAPVVWSARILLSLYGVWSLDFFRSFNLAICLDMSPLSVSALEYVIAAYPFFLTLVSYILIELHDRNYKIVVFVWKPFRCIFTLFRRSWDIRTSVIDAYASFYQLSCFKIFCVTADLLVPTYMHTISGSNTTVNEKLVLYYDGTIDYFGPEHLPYAIPAISIGFLFVILPTFILILYPLRCFQRLLNLCHINSHILHTLLDAFHGCYKDGTEPGTRDCRWFAGLDIILRIVLLFVFSFTLGSLFFPISTVVLLLVIILYSQVQPYKESVAYYNKIDLTFFSLLAAFFSALSSADVASIKAHFFVKGCYIVALIVCVIPLLYISIISIHWMFSRRRWGTTFINRVRAWRRGYDLLEESLPDRLENPDQYAEQGMEDTVNLGYESGSGAGIGYTD